MKRAFLICVGLFSIPSVSVQAASPAASHVLRVENTSITYPDGLEPQAKELAKICREVVPPLQARLSRAQAALGDRKTIAATITNLIGCPEGSKEALRILSQSANIAQGVSAWFEDIRLYRERDLRASGGIKEGPVEINYDAQSDTFSGAIRASSANAGEASKAFTPFLVRDDGSFRTKGKTLREYVSDMFSDTDLLLSAVHEAGESVLVRDLDFYHPFARWFNDGVANWVMLQIIVTAAPEFEPECREMSLPRPEERPWQAKVNLLSWVQASYESDHRTDDDAALNMASYRFATEAVDRLLRDQPPGALATIVRKLKGKRNPETKAICEAITAVTGKDAYSILLDYVPEQVRVGIKEGRAEKLIEQGGSAISRRDYAEAVRWYSEALEITPSDADLRANLAMCMRRAGMPKAESERQINIAVALVRQDPAHTFRAFQMDDDETWYVLGRVCQLQGRKKAAKEIFEHLPPTHPDARAALMELRDKP